MDQALFEKIIKDVKDYKKRCGVADFKDPYKAPPKRAKKAAK